MLGDSGRSFVVGFGENYPKQPHHKAASCESPPAECTWGTFGDISKDNPHQLNGALVGGPSNDQDSYTDDRTNYITNEVTLDYNAGFQGAVAALKDLSCSGGETTNPTSTTAEQSSTTESTSVSTTNSGTTLSTLSSSSTTQATSTSTEQQATTTELSSTTSGSLSCAAVLTNSWANNVQGTIKITVPQDISQFTINLETDVSLTNIQVKK